MTIPRKVQYNEALDNVNAILCQKIIKNHPTSRVAGWKGVIAYYVTFFLKNHFFVVSFYKILAVTTSEVAGVQVVKLERTSHICYFSIDFVREKLKKYKYMANEKKSRLTKKNTLA